jgi:DNA repair exonuclease SbcCD ATPase subunit
MINIKTVVIKNAGRFVGEHKIHLSDFSGLIQVNGKNTNTGGSSGSGKSTVFESIMYALGIGSVPSTILQSRLTKDSLEVTVIFDKDGEEYTVTRSKSDGLVFKTPTQSFTGSNKVAEEELQKTLSIPTDLVARVLHKKQKERGFFMSLTPKQTHAFLSTCLGLEEWTRKQARAQEELKIKILEKDALSITISNNKNLLNYVKQQTDQIVIPDGNPVELALNAQRLKTTSESLDNKIKELEAERSKEVSGVPNPVSENIKLPDTYHDIEKNIKQKRASMSLLRSEKQKKRIDSLNKIKTLESTITKAGIDSEALVSVEKELKTLKAEILKLRENICPTCTQPWENGHQNSKLNSAIDSYKKLMTKEEGLKQSILSAQDAPELLSKEKELLLTLEDESDITQIEAEIIADEAVCAKIQADFSKQLEEANQNNNKLMSEYIHSVSAINKKYDDLISPLKFDSDNKKSLSIKIESESKALKNSIDLAKTQKEKNLSEISRLSGLTEVLEKDLDALSNKIDLIEIASKSIESYINFSFQNSLSQIATRANDILSRVSNTATTTISFDAYKETKSGSIKEEVTILVHMDDELKVPLKSLSGGEETAIELAVDLAVIEMIEERAGIGFDLYILDEPFDGLDSVCKANCLEILSNSGLGKKIVIVDHSEETKEMVASKITAVREGQNSRIEVAS